jgi:hypothetical protein
MFRGRTASPYTMPDWTAMYAPRRCKKCGQPLPPSANPADLYSQVAETYNAYYAPMMENLARLWGGTASPWTVPTGGSREAWPGMPGWPGSRTHKPGHRHSHDCGCDEGECDGCHADNCHCHCCVHDADLVVQARLGERRVVPLTIENPRRRERQIRLELGNWTTRSGSPADVKGRLLPPAEFTLGPCEEREVILLVEADIKAGTNQPPGAAERDVSQSSTGLSAAAEASAANDNRRQVPDVEDCEVYYADLRVEGCDMRPMRIALVLLPRDCAAHPIDCGCGCC